MRGVKLPESGHLVVLGQTGLGKSAFVRTWMRELSAQDYPRVLVADKDDEYGAVAVGVSSLDDLTAYVAHVAPPWRLAYQGADLLDVLPALADAAYEIAGGTLLVAEEANLWQHPNAIAPELQQLIVFGRKRRAWICSVARRAGELHPLSRSQARHVIAFGMPEPIDAKYVREAMSGAVSIEELQRLAPLEGLWWDRRTRELVRLQVDPAALVIRRLDRQDPAA